MRLRGQAALVTGGGTGIGRGISLALAREGASVVINYQNSKDKAEATVREIRESGGRAVAVQADVRRETDVKRLVDETVRDSGRLDVLVNNAGWTSPVSALEARGPDRRDLAEGSRYERDGPLVLHQARGAGHARRRGAG